MKRSHVNKHRGARRFRQQAGRTHGKNLAPPPMRGGFRL